MKNLLTTTRNAAAGLGRSVGIITYFSFGLIGAAIHLWTISLAWYHLGILSAVAALCLPVVAQIAMFIYLLVGFKSFILFHYVIITFLISWLLFITLVNRVLDKD